MKEDAQNCAEAVILAAVCLDVGLIHSYSERFLEPRMLHKREA